jgi:hypothetical protein
MPINSSSIPSLRVAREVRRRRRAEGGGLSEADEQAMMPETYQSPLGRGALGLAKGILWDLPKRAIDSAVENPMPGLRREDYTDIPGAAQPVDPMVGASLETALNTMGAPLVSGTTARAGETVLGSGAIRRSPAGDLSHIDDIIAREKALANEPRTAAAPEPAAAPDPAAVGPGGGGPSGAGGLPEAQATAARWAGERQPLEGIPGPLKIGEDHFVPGPIGKVHDVAEDYMRTVHPDRPYTPPERYHPLDPEHSKAIARAYEDMQHTPNDPATKASYNALIDETAKQYQAIKKTGLKIEPIPPGAPDPYAKNPRMAAIDVAENNHLWFFPTEGGFGTVNKITDNPMLRPMGEKIGDHQMLANDMFRVVHDYFGHLKEGHGFRAPGEDNAWRAHAAMYSDLARPAMTTETRGQNSWVNYGPHGDVNRKASAADTTYADQKVGLMPEWTMRDRGSPEPIIAYHGSPHSFERFDSSHMGAGEGNQAYGHGLYFAGHSPVSEWYRHQLAIRRDPLIEKYGLDSEQGSWLGQHLHSFGGDADRAIADIDKQIRNLKYEQANGRTDLATANMIRDREAKAAYLRDPQRNPGTMYQVAIDANPEHFLNWDANLGQQSPLVQDFARPLIEDQFKTAREARQRIIAKGTPREVARLQMKPFAGDRPIEEVRGPDIYKRAGLPALNQSEGFVKSTQRMKAAGIPGIKYLDQGSRGVGAGTHNYVTFDDNMLRILRKYGVAGIPAAGVLGADGEERRATGGGVNKAMEVARRVRRAKGGSVHIGPIMGDTDGRADEVPMEVPDGAYVLTADHVSSMGEGNTLAGFKKLNGMFPESAKARTANKEPIRRASGGKVPIYAADGEYVICPEDIINRWGDLDHGHRILDEWQTAERKEHVETLKGLAPPAQD